MDEKQRERISSFINKYILNFRRQLREKRLPRGSFSFAKPTNYYLHLDKTNLHMIFSSEYAGGIPEVMYYDMTKYDAVPIEAFAEFIRGEKGLTDWSELTFNAKVLDLPEAEQSALIDRLTNEQMSREYQAMLQQHQRLSISIEQLRKFLEVATEDDLINILLVPLLRTIGFKTAEPKGHKDRSLEFGQDIRKMKIQIPTGHWLYFSAQVKTGDINANTTTQKGNVERILTQTKMQLNWEMFDPETNQKVKPDHIMLIVSGDISEAAKQYVYTHELYRTKRVLMWEKGTIIRFCEDQGLPEATQKSISKYVNKKS